MDWTEFQSVKARIPAGWKLDEDENMLLDADGMVIVMCDDTPMFRALVADAINLPR